MARRGAGFTLLELMVVVAILAVLVAVALPSYRDYQRQAHRTTALAALGRCAQGLERFHVERLTYQDADLAQLCASQSPSQEEVRYRLVLSDAGATGYTLTANPVGAQAGDGALRLLASGVRYWDQDGDGVFEDHEVASQF